MKGMRLKEILRITTAVFTLLFMACKDKSDALLNNPSNTGKGGSMARFVIANNTLYTVDKTTIKAYDITDATNPTLVKSITLNPNPELETIFYYQNKLFIGSRIAMYIYDVSNPLNPVHLSTYGHVLSCDPVVVQGDTAYVTLRAGNNCGRFLSSLEVIDISNPSNPKLIKSVPMQSPYGLGVRGSILFVCEGENGFKVFDITNPSNPVLVKTITGMFGYDVIPLPNLLLLTGSTGLYQYTYTNPNDIQWISTIPVQP
ncbi:MAG: hypothetical protein NZ455_06485 [Bacteroidia bacterium]|nr:hypothetical protein [Bacteroidia bacterium]MDW8347170.1 hypothetical protein [Bacteroidia bacterium]